jgi:hypothetical protein
MREELVMLIVMPTMFVVSGWAFKTLLNFIQQRQLTKLHYSLQDKLLEKLGSSPEAVQYLHSDAGEKMFALATRERTNPYTRILSALQAGAVLSLLGLGFIVLRYMTPSQDAVEGFTVIGVLGISLGLGFLASSAAAYVFSKNWGLINGSSSVTEG